MRLRTSYAILFSLLLASPLAAQTGTITGQVTDREGVPIGFAQVLVEGTDLGTVADESGRYTIQGVPAGSRQIRATFLGYQSTTARVDVGAEATVTRDLALAQDYLAMEAIVATAQQAPRQKLETSVAITTLQPRDIEREAPRSTADLLKVIPGFYVESSGGEVGGNLFARGLPADGSFRYVALLEDGMPVYDSTELSFINADIFVRVDNNIRQIEAVRGGSAALFSSNAPGGIVNFISKTGGPAHSGIFTARGAQAGLAKLDFNVNGPLSESGWNYSLGGFYRYDGGIRDPGFAASNGGQIKANVTREYDTGHIRIYGKFLNDRNVFYLPLPLRNPEDPEFVEGFPEDGTLTSDAGDEVTIPEPRGGSRTLNLSDGQKQTGGSILVDAGKEFGDGWSVSNAFRYMDVEQVHNAMVPGSMMDADEWAQGFVDDTPGAADFRLTYAGSGETFSTPNGLVNLGLQWEVTKPMTNVSDQISIRKVMGDHSVRFGGYFGHYTADNFWMFSDQATEIANAPRLVDLEILGPGGDVVRRVTDDGFRQYWSLYVNGEGDVDLAALFAGGEFALSENLDADVGFRYEWDSFTQMVELTDSFDIGPTDAEQGLSFGTGEFITHEGTFDDWAVSVGGNYRATDRVSLYARGTRGYKMPILDQLLFLAEGSDPESELQPEEIIQVEGGVKVGSPRLGLSAVAYWLSLRDFPISDAQILPDGSTAFVTIFAGEAVTIGSEIEIVAAPTPNLRLNGSFTFQRPEFEELNVTSDGELESLAGNQVRRIPKVIADVGAEVDVGGNLTLLGGWSFIGQRYSNNENTIELDAYNLFDLGAEYRLPLAGVTLSLDVANVADAGPEALTEGNPRVDEFLGAQNTLFFARPVLPRRVTAGVSYEF